MALTDAQMASVRRYAGYPLSGTTQPVSANTDIVYLVFGMRQMSLYERLTTLSATEETVLTTVYLAKLATLEDDVFQSRTNLDTAKASVWEWNSNEIGDRAALFNRWRREMCNFLGLAYGPGLGDGSLSVMRA